MRLPEVRLHGECCLERCPRRSEARGVPLDRAFARGLQLPLELGVADPEARPARLSRDLARLLDLEQGVELAARALGVPTLVHGARGIEDRKSPRLNSR